MRADTDASSTGVIEGWKGIATYLERDVRTVMRWERRRGLPVHRLPGGPKSAVYALKAELETWRASRTGGARTAVVDASSSLSPTAPAIPSIAVLPFANLSSDKENEYFSDGLADEVITALSRIRGLRVIARTSSFAFRGREQDVRGIGTALGVTTLLEGSVQRAEGRVRVSAQLIDCRDGSHLWAERYDANLDSPFAVQEDIAAAIARALRATVEPSGAGRKPPVAEAYHLWLKGRYHQSNGRTLRDFATARECFARAVVLQPDFGPAHLALGQLLLQLSGFGAVCPKDVAPALRDGIAKALAWDERSGEAHAAQAKYRALFDFDWTGAEAAVSRGLTCEPTSPDILRTLAAWVLAPTGRLAEAEQCARRAMEGDPLSPFSHFVLAQVLLFRRDYDGARASIRTTLESASSNPFVQWVAGLIDGLQGRPLKAIEQCEQAARVVGPTPMLSAGLGMLYGWAGQRAKARDVLQQLAGLSGSTYISPMYPAWVHLGIGEIDEAFGCLERAIECRDPHVLHVPVKPAYDALRGDARFDGLLRRMNLPYR